MEQYCSVDQERGFQARVGPHPATFDQATIRVSRSIAKAYVEFKTILRDIRLLIGQRNCLPRDKQAVNSDVQSWLAA
ncbi:hypothetical protein BJX96DRAFT_144091 [Aspergillus floccosus]